MSKMDSYNDNKQGHYDSNDPKPDIPQAVDNQRSPQLDKKFCRSHSRYGYQGNGDGANESPGGNAAGGAVQEHEFMLPDSLLYMSSGESMAVEYGSGSEMNGPSSMILSSTNSNTNGSIRSMNSSALLGFVGSGFESHALPNFTTAPIRLGHEANFCLNMSIGNINHNSNYYPVDLSIDTGSEPGEELTPLEEGGDEGLEDHKVEVADLGLVSIREVYLALARHKGCTCHAGVLPDGDDYPFTEYDLW